ncbi:hypothetical protein [Shewanella sp. Isolate8]|uniref:hypothetical protein n=1 Tax=Shewanella sp. Isolate8 TaxID=2908529 RepID=UPI001EFE6052|nr:hypothetical protein [Shewanella sp. Isolate8]MCG9747112.1 hypothetical protein [Shewanella sp. Isolate8]
MSIPLESAPRAGDSLMLNGRPVYFLAPLPVMSLPDDPLLPPELVLQHDEVILDLGQGKADRDLAFQTRFVIFILYLFGAIFIAAGMQEGELDSLALMLTLALLSIVMLAALMGFGWQVIRRRRRPTIRFNRQRRELCYRDAVSGVPRFVPWESVVAYVHGGTALGATAIGRPIKMEDHSLRLAEYQAHDGSLHNFYQGEGYMVVNFSLENWEAIRRFMEEPKENWLRIDPLPDSQGFRRRRRDLWQRFKDNPNKRWLHINLRDYSESWLTMGAYYLFHLLSWWQLPYSVSAWYLRLAVVRPWPDVVAEWSQPLPQSQWAQPSEQYLEARAAFLKTQQAA